MTLISWLRDIPFYISTTTSLSIFLFPCIFKVEWSGGSCQQSSTKLWGACVLLIFSFPNLYAHEWNCPMLSELCFLDVSGHTVHFSRVAVGNLHPANQRSKAPISPWPVLHFWFWHFFHHVPFDRWEARILCSADLPFQVAWLAKKGVFVFSWIYSGKNAYALFGQGHHCRGFAAFPVL